MIEKGGESKREEGIRGRGKARESEKREGVGKKKLSLFCLFTSKRAQIGRKEGERANSLLLVQGGEMCWRESTSLHGMHEMILAAKRRIARNNAHVRMRARKQGGEEKERRKRGRVGEEMRENLFILSLMHTCACA